MCRPIAALECSGNSQQRCKSSALALEDIDPPLSKAAMEIQRIKHLRNVGILAHVDAGKTTVTERMLALAGVVRSAGNVDDGNTVTDYLPAERERGITIQSAAISFDWGWHNNKRGDDYEHNDSVRVQLIDTPGHVDFSVEVNRSVAVLDGAVLVVDAVAGVQAQTETVWRAITRPSLNNHTDENEEEEYSPLPKQDHTHEPLPCLALVNKMDKDGCNFGKAIKSLKDKLPGANPIPIQLPLFHEGMNRNNIFSIRDQLPSSIVAVSPGGVGSVPGEFVGVVDLIHMRAILWPDKLQGVANVENCIPTIVNLVKPDCHEPINPSCHVTLEALNARFELVESLAEVDPAVEEYYLNDEEPTNAELRAALRRATLGHKAVPVMAAAALKGKGVEPLLDAVADLLPSPLDRAPPAFHKLDEICGRTENLKGGEPMDQSDTKISLGHPLHPSTLALAFKVVHMKGRGGSGDGRVVFARVYSGKLRDRETIQVISPPPPGEAPAKPREERIGGMLELSGGSFENLEGGVCKSGDVCALVGLKTVVTGDTIMLSSDNSKQKKSKRTNELVYLAGVAPPKPVITVRLEAETSAEQTRLSEALRLMAIEDPSLVVEETESTTLLSGLGELHIEVALDRLFREHGLTIMVGSPSVAYRETVKDTLETPGGLFELDQTIGGTRLQGAVQLTIKPFPCDTKSSCALLSDPVVTLEPRARNFLGLNQDLSEDELMHKSDLARALIRGIQGALKRGPLKSAPMANLICNVEDVDAEGGLAALKALPGALQATAANAVTRTLKEAKDKCTVLEPTMSVEVTLPNDMVGIVLSDLNGRRGTVGDVIHGDGIQNKSLVRGDVPLVEILGYANSLRSLTGGEAAFSAEYKGHSPY